MSTSSSQSVASCVTLNLKKGIGQQLFHGVALGVTTPHFQDVYCCGVLYPHGPSVLPTNVFDLASITKSFVTILFFHLLEIGKLKGLSLESYLKDLIPIEGEHSEKIQVKHLLWFLVEFKTLQMSEMVKTDPGANLKKALMISGLTGEPGKFNYCNHTAVMLGMLIEYITGEDLEVLVQKHLLEPLFMEETSFRPHSKRWPLETFVPTEGFLRGVVHDEGARHQLYVHSQVIASSGIFSTSSDMLKLLSLFIRRGVTTDGKRILSEAVIDSFGKNAVGDTETFGNGFGLWSVFTKGFEDVTVSSEGAFFKSGFAGGCIAVFPADEVAFFIGNDFLTLGRRDKRELFKWMVKTISDAVRVLRG